MSFSVSLAIERTNDRSRACARLAPCALPPRYLRHLTASAGRCDDRRVASEDVSALRDVYDAFDRHDVDGLLALLPHDVAVVTCPRCFPGAGRATVATACATYFDLLDEHVDDGWGDPDEYLDAGERVVVLGRLRGRARATGEPFEARFVHVWDFQRRRRRHLSTASSTPPWSWPRSAERRSAACDLGRSARSRR